MDNILKFLGIENMFPFIFNQSNQDENIAYTSDLPNVDVTAFAADYQLGSDADFNQYKEWALEKKRKEAWEKAQLVRAGFAPLTTKASDSDIFQGDDLKMMQEKLGDTIQSRHDNGLYFEFPFMEQVDSTLYNRMNEPCSGYSCINSQTNYYGRDVQDMNNIHFEKNHHGFIPVPLDSLKQGDIVQGRKWWEDGYERERPAHATMFDSYDENGDIRVWDQHGWYGMITPELNRFLYKSPDPDPTLIYYPYRAKNGFRYIGSPLFTKEVIEKFKAYLKRNGREDEIKRLNLD